MDSEDQSGQGLGGGGMLTRAAAVDRGITDPTATEHGAETYLPEPRSLRSGVALCLSGGGFRAALFHLGALTRLNELGVLSQIQTISIRFGRQHHLRSFGREGTAVGSGGSTGA